MDFPIQLWDKIAPHVQDSINLLRRSRVDPTKSVYEILKGPYDWNRYPLAPLGTKAVIYEDANTRASWAPQGLDAWLLGPLRDHYHCNLYYVPELKGYCVSGSANLFPRHCIAPAFTPLTHIQELSTELQETLAKLGCTRHTYAILKTLAQYLNAYVSGTAPPQLEQRNEQRVVDIAPPTFPPGIQRVSNACGTPLTNNPTSTCILQNKLQTHLCKTQANTPGVLPKITRATLIEPLQATTSPPTPSTKCIRIAAMREAQIMSLKSTKMPRRSNRLALPRLHHTRLISQEAIAHLLTTEQTKDELPFTPSNLCKYGPPPQLRTLPHAHDSPHHRRTHQQL